MKFQTALLFVVLLTRGAWAEEETFYVGAVADIPSGPARGIYLGHLDSETGKLSPLTLAAPAKNPGFLVFSPDHKFIYATNGPNLAAFAVGKNGALTPLNEQPAGNGSTHVSVDTTGHHVFFANYGDGIIGCFSVKPDGSLGEQTALIPFKGSGPNPNRQTKSYAHAIYASPDNKFVYACDLGSDNVWVFKFDSAKGTLVPSDPPSAKVPPGGGPRHLVFSPKGDFVYVANEMGNSVTTFSRNAASGALTALETVSTLAVPKSKPEEEITTAEIVSHPSGRWIYVSNRDVTTSGGEGERISVFARGDDGHLKLIEAIPSPALFPRNFAVDPDGRWLLVAGQKDNRIALVKIDQATGRLTTTTQVLDAGSPFCVLFVPKK